ncbi:MAG TPA: hypothetical protein VG652_12725 [Gaiellaceae bacterium]|nr:hypothetical protein [Gaiellaceae bacterium]
MPQSGTPIPQQVLQPVAQLLGTTPQDLIGQMQSGTTLATIARQQGVSQADLTSAIEQGLQAASPANSSTTPGSLASVATSIANGTAKIGHHHHHHSAAPSASQAPSLGVDDDSNTGDDDGSDGSAASSTTSTVNSLASILGLDPSRVLQLLNTGTTIAGLAAGSSLPASDLQSLFSTGLQVDTTA